MTLSKKKTKVWLASIGSVLMAAMLVLSGIGIYFKINPKMQGSETKGDPLDFSIDAWDGKSVSDSEYNVNYAGRGQNSRTIDSAESFLYFVEEVNSGSSFEGLTVYLNKSIDLKGFKINSIGSETNPFKGTFDGGFYTLYNLNIEGNGLFGQTENATIKNLGLYNPTIKSKSGIAGGLIGTAVDTKVENTFVNGGKIKGERVGGLVGEYIINSTSNNNMTSFNSSDVENKISNSFVDTEIKATYVGGLVHTLINNTFDGCLSINDSYYTTGDRVVSQYEATSLETNRVIRPIDKTSFANWQYSSKYESGELWCDYDYLGGTQELEFSYPIQSGFVKVYLTGSHYETVVITGDKPEDVVNVSNLSEAFTQVNNSTQEATINLIVEKVFMEARAETKSDTVITVNAIEDTTLVRGTHNEDSMFVATENSKIVLGSATETLADGTEAATITLDGNREQVEKENLESGALVVGYGGAVEIHDNVVLQNNVNTNVKYGGAVLLYGVEEMPDFQGKIENCSAEYSGGGICAVGSSIQNFGTIEGCSTMGNGGAVAVLGESDMEHEESVKAMVSLYGGDGKVVPTVTVDPDNFTIGSSFASKNNAYGLGGALYFANSTSTSTTAFTINSVTFSANYAGRGGAVAIGDVSTSSRYAVVTGCTFRSNYAKVNNAVNGRGGAIFVLDSSVAQLSLVNTNTFISNQAQYNATYATTSGWGGSICTISTSTRIYISGKLSIATANSYDAHIGGGIYSSGPMAIAGNAQIDISGLSTTTAAGAKGGGIYVNPNYMLQTPSGVAMLKVYDCNAYTDGGGIYCGMLQFAGTIIAYGNMASTGNGGAIYGTTIKLAGNTYHDFYSEDDEGYITGNTAGGKGGSIYYTSSLTIMGTGLTTFDSGVASTYGGAIAGEGSLTISSATNFKNNRAESGSGGAIAQLGSDGETITLNANIEFSGNSATTYGGAIYSYYDLDIDGTVEFENNTAEDGGAIYEESDGSMTISGTATFGNANSTYFGNIAKDCGGAIHIGDTTLTISGTAKFYYNEATGNGGAIYSDATLNLGGTLTFTGNSATRYGGAIYNCYGTNITKTATFTKNSAGIDGGAIYQGSDGLLNITGTANFGLSTDSTSGNSAGDGGGGAIYIEDTLSLGGTTNFYYNTATGDGGAIYVNTGDVTIAGTPTFANNSAGETGWGGAIYTDGETTISAGTFTSNSATYYGGAIATCYNLTVSGAVTFTSNSSRHGGAIYVEGSDARITGAATFTSNTATVDGGAISITGGCYLILNSSTAITFSNNSAPKGGAIRVDSSGIKCYGKATFSNNTANGNGGAIYIYADNYDWVYDVTTYHFVDNTASGGDGGAIYAYDLDGDLTINNTRFDRNSATGTTGGGGAIWCDGNVVIEPNSAGTTYFYDNETSAYTGMAIYSEATVTLCDSVIFGVTAEPAQSELIYAQIVKLNGDIEFADGQYYADIYISSSTGYVEINSDITTCEVNVYKNGLTGYTGSNLATSTVVKDYNDVTYTINIVGGPTEYHLAYMAGSEQGSHIGYMAANTYTVKYNGNGSTSGSMSNVSHTYGVAKALTANAFAKSYTVTYNANGGSVSPTSATVTYTFAGWAKTATGAVDYTNSQSVSNLTSIHGATVNLYAIWTSGTTGVGTKASSKSTTLPTATRAGYTTTGWNTKADGTGTSYSAAASYTPSANITLYAKWAANSYTVNYNPGGGLISLAADVQCEVPYKINWATNFAITTEFNYAATGSRYFIFGNYSGSNHLNIEITTAGKLRVYINNANVDKTLSKVVPTNKDISVSFTWTASTKAWSFSASGAGFSDSASGTSTVTGTSAYNLAVGRDYRGTGTFKAIKIAPLTIKTGDGSPVIYYYKKSVTYNSSYGTLPTASRTGYTFNSWTINYAPALNSSNYSASMYSSRTTYEYLSGSEFNSYIRVNGNASTSNIDTAYWIKNNTAFSVTAGSTYRFSFYARSANSAVNHYINSSTSGYNTMVIWSDGTKSYPSSAISFANDGYWHYVYFDVTVPTGVTKAQVQIGNDTPNIYGTNSYVDYACLAFTKVGSTITASSTVSISSDHSVIAQWTANTNTAYTVYHYLENAEVSGALTTSNCTLKETQNLTGTTAASVTPAVKSYTGFTAPSTQTVTIAADGSTKVYYYYTRNSYTLTAVKGTGISKTSVEGYFEYGGSIAISATVSTGYTWSKWTVTSGTTPTTFTPSTQSQTIVMGAGDVTLTASATLNIYTITYNLDGGSVSPANPTSYNITTETFTLNNPTKAGYTFAGWTGSNGTTASTTVSIAKGSTGNKSYTATWRVDSYTVTYNANNGYKNLLLNGDVESVKTNSSVGWDNSLNGTTVASSGWGTGYNGQVSNPTVGYHAHVTTVDGNHVIRFKTNEAYSSSISALRWLGITQDLTTLTAGHTYRWSMDVYRVSGTGNVYGGPYYTTTSNTSKAFQSGTSYFTPAQNGTWQRISNTFTIKSDLTSTSVRMYIYGYAAQGEIYVDNITLEDITSGATQTTTVSETYASNYKLAPTVPVRTGYTFAGWYTSASGGTQVTTSTKVSTAGAHTLYAHWTALPSYFNANWQSVVRTALSTTNSKIKTIQFVSGTTLPSGFSSDKYFYVGGTDRTSSASINDSVLAYYKGDATNGYDLAFVSPSGGTIYAPTSCNNLFRGYQDYFTNLASIKFDNFNTGLVTNMAQMFDGCSALTSLNLSSWDTSSVTDIRAMFRDCSALTTITGIEDFNTDSVTNIGEMFYGCSSLTSLDLSDWDTSCVKYIYGMFANCSSLTSLDLSNFNTSAVTDMDTIFINCSSLTSLDLSGWNTSSVKTAYRTFENCSSLTSLDLSDWNTSSITNMGRMFLGCSKLTSLNVSSFNTSSVTSMSSMFDGCSSLISLDVSGFNTSSVTDMSHMFNVCSTLTSLVVSNFNTSLVTSMTQMFNFCSALTELDISSFDLTNVTNVSSMLSLGYYNNINKLVLPKEFGSNSIAVYTGSTMCLSGTQTKVVTGGTSITLNSTYEGKTLVRVNLVTANANGGSISSSTGWTGTGSTATKYVAYNETYGTLPTGTKTGYSLNGWYFNNSATDYTFVEYIQSSGTQWINTGYYWTNENIQIVLDAIITNASGSMSLFGNEEYIGTSSSRNFGGIPYGGNGTYQIYIGNGNQGSVAIAHDTRFTLDIATTTTKNVTVKLNGTQKLSKTYTNTVIARNSSWGNSGYIYLFSNFNSGRNSTTAGTQLIGGMKVYSFKLYDGGKLVRDMRPCVKADGTVGMLDLVEGKFYENSGSGTFTAGTKLTRVPVTSTTNILLNNDHTILANWTANTYTIAFDANGGSGSMTSLTGCKYDTSYTLTANSFTKTGYRLYNWNTKADGTGTSYSDKQTVSNLTSTAGATVTLYAQWRQNYSWVKLGTLTNVEKVYYGLSSDSTTLELTTDETMIYSNTFYFKAILSSVEGYTVTFSSWSGWFSDTSNPSGAHGFTENGQTYIINATATKTANTYTIAFNANGGSGSMTSLTGCKYDTSYTLTANSFTRTGYSFNGWNTKADGTGTSYSDKQTVSNLTSINGATVTLYAQWKINTYVVTWKSQDGATTLETDSSVAYGTIPSFDGTNPTKPSTAQYSYTFDGWSTSANQTSGTAEANLSAVTGAVTYYAAFKPIERTYTVSVVSNNTAYGTVDKASVQNVLYGSTITVNGNKITVNGTTVTATAKTATAQYTYTFTGWSVSNGATVTGATTITATFTRTENKYTVSVVSNNTSYGTVDKASVANVPYGSTIEVNGNTIKVNGTVVTATAKTATAQYTYTFSGWSVSNGATVSGDITITATFVIFTNEYTVSVVSNNTNYGTVNKGSILNVPYGSTIEVDGNTIKVNGTVVTATEKADTAQYTYTFTGWSVSNGATVTGATTITATFTRTENKYTVSVVSNNTSYGTVDIASVANVPYGSTITVDGNKITVNGTTVTATVKTVTGYTISYSWSVSNGATVTGDLIITVTFTATPITYTIAFDANSGSGSMTSLTGCKYNTSYTLTANAFTKTGYTFDGWNTAANGTGTSYANKASVKNLTSTNGATVTLYAQWTAKISYLHTNFGLIIGDQIGTTNSQIKSIHFVSGTTLPSGYSVDNYVNIGALGPSNINLVDSVLAYYKADGEYYHLAIMSPSGGTIYAPTTCSDLFYADSDQFTNLTSITFDNFNTSLVTDMTMMFYECSALTSLNVSEFDTSSVTKMGAMFQYCSSLTSLDLSNFNTSLVERMGQMFYGCSSLTSLDLSGWNTSLVTNMNGMFYGCSALTELDISNFDLTNVTNVNIMYMLNLGLSNKINKLVLPKEFGSNSVPITTSSKMVEMGTQTLVLSGSTSSQNITSTYEGKTLIRVNKLTANANGGSISSSTGWSGTGSTATRYVAYNETVSYLPTATKEGHTFKGWFTATTGETQYTTSSTISEDVTMYAQWTVNTYTVSVVSNNTSYGTVNVATIANVPYGSTITVSSNKITVNGTTVTATATTSTAQYTYTFTGWSVSNGATVTGATTITATFTRTEKTYTVSVVSNDTSYGTVDKASITGVKYGSTITVSGNTITVNGTTVTATEKADTAQYTYTFTGWSVSNGATVTGATTITATFTRTENKYTVSVVSNNTSYGTVDKASVTNVLYGSTITVDGNTITVNGTTVTATATTATAQYTYTFSSWSVSNGATVTGATTITATFTRTENKYTVSVVSNNTSYGTVDVSSITNVLYGSTIAVDGNTITVNGTTVTATAKTSMAEYTYTFTGWSVSNGATVSGDITITATFTATPITYTIAFDANGGSGTMDSMTACDYDTSYTLTANAFIKTGYTFDGWNTAANGSGTRYADRASVKNLASTNGAIVTLYAQWTTLQSYFNSNWQELVKTALNTTNSNIKTIEFVSGTTLPSGFNSTNYIAVGAIARNSTTVNDSVLAYYKGDATNGYDLAMVSPTGGTIYAPTSCNVLFGDNSAPLDCFKNLTSITFDNFDTSNITSMIGLLWGASSLTTVDLSGWSTSAVTDFSEMFVGCSDLTSLNLSGWDTSSVKRATAMFSGCSNLTSLNLSDWDTSLITNMSTMFSGCSKLTTLDLSGWNTSSVTNMNGMFSGCSALTELDISNFDLTKVTNVTNMMNFGSSNKINKLVLPKEFGSNSLPITTGSTMVQSGTQTKVITGGSSTNISSTYEGKTLVRVNTITADANGGTISSSTGWSGTGSTATRYVADNETIATLPTATRSSYNLKGWFTSTSGGTQFTTSSTISADTTMYAQWELSAFTVSIVSNNTNYGTVDEASILNVPYGSTIAVDGNTITVNGTTVTATATTSTAQYTYTFTGWSVSNGATVTSATTITATFTRTENKYTVSIVSNNADYGTVDKTSVQNVLYGSEITVDGNTMTVNGTTVTATSTTSTAQYTYTFTGWSVSNGATVSGDITITATFTRTENKYTVSIVSNNTNYGIVDKASIQNVLYGSTITVSGNTITINGTTVTATAKYMPGYEVDLSWSVSNGATVTGATTITATFTRTPINYTITLGNINEKNTTTADGSAVETIIEYNIETQLVLPEDIVKAYCEELWFEVYESAGSWVEGNTFELGEVLGTGHYGDVQLNLKWNWDEYTLIFNTNGRGTAVDSVKVRYNSTWENSGYGELPTSTAAGYTLAGWYRRDTLDSSYILKETTQFNQDAFSTTIDTENKTFTVYAKWTENQNSILFVSDGQVGGERLSSMFETVAYGTEVILPIDVKMGYTFAGWFTSASGGTKYDATLTMPDSELTLYAQWIKDNYTITFDANSGNVNPSTQTVQYGSELSLPTPNKTGYNADYWYYENSIESWDGETITAPSGSGTISDPYLIENGENLAYMSYQLENNASAVNNYQGVYFKQTKNIDLDQNILTPIGLNYNTGFRGTYNGNGFEIHNLWIDASATDTFYGGLFGWVGTQSVYGTIANVTLVDTNIYGNINASSKTISLGALVGTLQRGTIANCRVIDAQISYVDENVETDNASTVNAGLLVGNVTQVGYINEYYASGSITANGDAIESNILGKGESKATITNEESLTDETFGYSVVERTGQYQLVSGDNYPFGASVTLYAQWTARTDIAYTVYHYLENVNVDETLTTSNCTLEETQNLTGTADTTVTPEVNSYNGFTSPSVQTVTIEADGSTKVYYFYTRNKYELTMSAGTGISEVSGAGTYDYQQEILISATIKDGYKWGAWSRGGPPFDGTATPTNPTETVYMGNGPISLTATANPISYTIAFNANGGNGTMSSLAECEYDVSYTLPANEFTRTGYSFNGWNTNADGTGISYTNEASVMNLTTTDGETVTLYAQWKINTYTVTVLSNDTEFGTVDKNIVEDVPYGSEIRISGNTITVNGITVTATEKANTAQYTYAFESWSVENNYVVTKELTITATFTRTINKYTVTWLHENGTVLEVDENVEYGIVPTYNGETPVKENSAQFTYTHSGWSPAVESVKGNATYTATFSSTLNKYTVAINVVPSGYGTVSQARVENVPYGTVLSVNGNVVTINGTEVTATETTATAEFTYKFDGWSNGTATVEGNLTVAANFSRTVNKYTVTWLHEDGTELEVDENVEYGTMPEYNGETPVKPADDQYSYRHSGWNPEVSKVKGNVTYTATFSSDLNNFKVTWKNDDGTTLEVDSTVPYGTIPEYNGTTPTKNRTAQYTYTFAGWDKEIVAVTTDITYFATYTSEVNKYTVTIEASPESYGTVSQTTVENVPYGTMLSVNENVVSINGTDVTATATIANAQYTYTFANWTNGTVEVHGDVTVTANFSRSVNKYTVTIETSPEGYGTVSQTTVKNVPYGTILRANGNVLSVNGTEVTATETASDAQYTYSFVDWTNGAVEVQDNVTVVANFDRIVNTYTVTWVNEDGTELEVDENVPYGTEPSYNGKTPTKDKTAQYTYTHSGWTPAVESVKGNVTYTATFSSEVNNYTVTITVAPEGYGTVSQTTVENVPYGTTLSVNGNVISINGTEVTATETPANAQYTYSFESWTNGTIEVHGDEIVTANFNRTTNTYTITWKNEDGTELEVDENVEFGTMPEYNGETPTKEKTAQFTFTHSGWTPAIESVKGNVTYIATYSSTVNEYTVTWINHDGTELEVDKNVPYGTTPEYNGATPTKDKTAQYTYTFDKWTPEVESVTGDVTYTATFSSEVNNYTVTITVAPEGYGTVSQTTVENVPYGTTLSANGNVVTINGTEVTATETKANAEFTYKFDSWSNATATVEENLTVVANFSRTVNKYTVTWVNEDGTALEVDENVEYGTMPEYNGETPTKDSDVQYSYTFDKWTPERESVTGDVTYTATYSRTLNKYTVTITVAPEGYGTVSLATVENVPYGTTLSANGNVVTINGTEVTATETAADAQYTYSFVDWTNGTATVEGELTVTANFDRTINKYTVRWVNEDGTELEVDENVDFGTTPEYNGATPTKDSDVQYTYTFDKWTPEVESVTGNVTFTATYIRTLNKYTVTFVDDESGYGSVVSSNSVTSIKVDYGTPISVDDDVITIADVTFTATPKASENEYSYEFSGWSNVANAVTKDFTITANFIRLVEITIETTGVDGNTYGVQVYNENNELINTTPYTDSFRLETDKVYSIKVVSDLISNKTDNKYQILRVYVDETLQLTQDSLQGAVSSTVCNKETISETKTIKFEYISAHFLTVNLEADRIGGINVTEINEENNIVIKYTTENGYLVADGTKLTFSVNSTPVSTTSVYTFIGFNYTINGEVETVGVNGGTDINYVSHVHNSQYVNDTDVGTYYYSIEGDVNITDLTVLTVTSAIVYSINTTKITDSITLTSEHGFNKVVDSSTTSLILYAGTWKVTTTMTLAQVQEVFVGYTVQQDAESGVITIEVV